MKCRFCASEKKIDFINLGKCPPSNAYILNKKNLNREVLFNLKTVVCLNCWLVQTIDTVSHKKLFNKDYAYFSGYSKTWLTHCEKYSNNIIKRLNLNQKSLVLEIASNDGTLLDFFKKKKINVLGIEPTLSTARISRNKNINTINSFFTYSHAKKLKNKKIKPNLIIGNNVIAHVPKINDFVKGISLILDFKCTATFEFPHLLNLIEKTQFDTIYHEHFSYYSLSTINRIFDKYNMNIYDVEKLRTHGGSLRIYVEKNNLNKKSNKSKRFINIIKNEISYKLEKKITYKKFQKSSYLKMKKFRKFIYLNYKKNKQIIGYGAAAKSNTLLNYAGINNKHIDYVVDKNPNKIGKFLPGSKIPICDINRIKETKPDIIIVFAWNIFNEIKYSLKFTKKWKCKIIKSI